MKRPGKAGQLLVLAFAVLVIIELRTVLAMVGLHVPLRTYLLVSGILVLVAFLAIVLAPWEGNRRRENNTVS